MTYSIPAMMTALVIFHQNIFPRFLRLSQFALPTYTLFCTLLVASFILLQGAAKMDKASHL